jgi:hypothetical protein
MSTGGVTEYDSAAFAHKNPGSTYKDHGTFHQNMSAAFDAYLTQKYGFHGIVQCSQHNTLAEAQQWLQWRESQVRAITRPDAKYVATDWTYGAGAGEAAASATTSTQDATSKPSQPAAPATHETPTFFTCSAVANRVQYDSAVFEARADAGYGRRMMFTFSAFLAEKYQISAMPRCTPQPTQAAAQAYADKFAAGVSGGVSQRIATGWVYSTTATAPAQPVASAAAPSAASAPKPVAPPPAAPKPAAPQPVAAATATTAAVAASPPARKTMFVVCKADNDPRTRYYNPPVDGGDGSYATWQPSYESFMKTKYHYERGVGCNKQPTLAEAQAYYDTMLQQARIYTSINGVPSPIVITDWKFQ